MTILTRAGLLAIALVSISGSAFSQWSTSGNFVSSGDVLGSTNIADLVLITNNTERLRLNTSGGLEQGFGCTASGANGQAFGSGSTASGLRGFAANYQTTASGANAAAFNYQTTASGDLSFAANGATTAQSYEQAAFGRFNFATGSSTTWVSTDPLFQIGNGTGTGILGLNAFELLKNGDCAVSGTFTSSSDARLKENIVPLSGVLGKLSLIQPTYFTFIDTIAHPGGRQLGFIAQDVEKAWPELVHYDARGYRSVAYGNMSAVAIEAIKEQQAIIKSQDERIARLEAAIAKLTGNSGGSAALGMLDTSGK
jgi:hypothetical protein